MSSPPDQSRGLGFHEFVALAAALMATQAIAIDAMLPALPTIVQALQVSSANRGQWVITAYVTGVGIGQLFWGLISDRFGRRPVLLAGLAVYALAATLCALSANFTALLIWRLLHGLAAASLVVTRSVIRDRYSGRHMARVMSLTFIVFLMVPVIAPSLGQLALLVLAWRSLFNVFALFGALVWVWALLRLPETLHPEYRLTLTGAHISGAVRRVATDRASLCYTLAMTVMIGSLLAYLGMMPQIFAKVFRRATLMPSIFALCAVGMGLASLLNSRIVERIGMRRISHAALLTFIAAAAVHVLVAVLGLERLWTFVVLQALTMASFSLAVSNFGAMAMEPIGAVAGIGAALQGCATTAGGALVGALIGRQFHDSTATLAVGTLGCGLASLGFVLLAERGRLFRPHQAAAALEPGL